jgi:hypothetical protein
MTGIRRRGRAAASLSLVEAAIDILEQVQPATVRAVCYQLFTRKVIASMARNEINRVSRLLREARERGEIPWSSIVDETREPERINAWENPTKFVECVRRSYRRDRWADQPLRVEVWSEKGTVRGTLAPVLNEYGVTFRVMHGYGSATAVCDAAQESVADRRQLIVLYVGDWDPSGLAMSETDLPDRIRRYGGSIVLQRIAIAFQDTISDDDGTGALPWFSATDKHRDPRYRWFVERHGRQCWELDALNPAELRGPGQVFLGKPRNTYRRIAREVRAHRRRAATRRNRHRPRAARSADDRRACSRGRPC